MQILGWRHCWTILFENEARRAVTVTSPRYSDMITHDEANVRYRPDGAIWHAVRASFKILRDTFSDGALSCVGDRIQHYFLWGYLQKVLTKLHNIINTTWK